MSAVVQIAGMPVQIVRRKMKNIRIVVKAPEGQVRVSAPPRVSAADIVSFVTLNLAWIRHQQQLIRARDYPPEPRFEDGERHKLWGLEKRLAVRPQVADGSLQRPLLNEEEIVLALPMQATQEQRQQHLERFYRRELEREMAVLVPYYQQLMGLAANEWRIKRMKTRWGSCNISDKRIWLNLHLARYPRECLAYVIVHELAHLVERYHNAAFWALVERYCPRWRAMRSTLNAS